MENPVHSQPDLETALGASVRERDGSADPRWTALSEGRLGSEEQAALRAESPELFEAYRPFDAQTAEAMTETVLARSGVGAKPPFRRRIRPVAAALAAVALAAALWLILVPPRSPLPEYELVVADARWRPGDPPVPVGRTRASPAEIVLRPATPVPGEVAVRAYLVRGTDVRRWELRGDVRPTGTIRISGPVDDLFSGVEPGVWDVYFVLGRPDVLAARGDALVDAVRAAARGDATTLPEGLQLLRVQVLLRSSEGR